jgi:5-(carboxyamino)imidazole ribonucleotide mutase
VSIGGAANAGLLAVRMLAIGDQGLRQALADYAEEISAASRVADEGLGAKLAAEETPRL